MLSHKKMWTTLGIILFLIVLCYLVLSRTINPDRYFLLKTERIPFRELYIKVSNSSYDFVPQIKPGRYSLGLGRSAYIDIPHHPLYRDEYEFSVDTLGDFLLTDLRTDRHFVVGKVLSKKPIRDYDAVSYHILIPNGYEAYYQETEGVFPYYQLGLTLMSPKGGKFKYSWEQSTVLLSPQGDSLQFYRNQGSINKQERRGIYPP